jgi:hypothetical protein
MGTFFKFFWGIFFGFFFWIFFGVYTEKNPKMGVGKVASHCMASKHPGN